MLYAYKLTLAFFLTPIPFFFTFLIPQGYEKITLHTTICSCFFVWARYISFLWSYNPNAFNYYSLATLNNGFCIPVTSGCIYLLALIFSLLLI